MGATEEIIIPKQEAEIFSVEKGDIFRVIAHEGPQVADIVFINANDTDESYCSDMSVIVNSQNGTGNLWSIKELYSRPPNMSLLATITEDTIGHHYPWCGGMCCSWSYETRINDPDHPNCADNLLDVLREYGLSTTKVPEVFNLGMNPTVEDDKVVYNEPEFGKGDFVEFRAEMDLIVAISACPNDYSVINFAEPKALKVTFD